MKLTIIEQALEQLLATDLSEQDRQHAFKALREVHETCERATDPEIYRDEVYLISASNMADIQVNNLYDVYAKRRMSYGGDFPADYFKHDARKVFGFEDFTNEQLQIGYDVISDLWADNEAAGNHDENGLFNCEEKPESAIIMFEP